MTAKWDPEGRVEFAARFNRGTSTPKLTKEEAFAIKDVYLGEASAFNQRLAMNVIVTKLCLRYENAFISGSQDETNYRLGRQSVGGMIADLCGLQEPFQKTPLKETDDE